MSASASPPRRPVPYVVVAAFAVLAILAVTTLGARHADAAELPKNAELLFALSSESGKFERSQGPSRRGRFQLTLRGLHGTAVWFTDRPQRDSGTIPTTRLFRHWKKLGFEDDPPNGALSLLRGPDRTDTVAFELRRPRLSESGSRLRLSVKLLDEVPSGLAHLADDLDRRLQRRFEDATLFIDDASTGSPGLGTCSLGDIFYMSGNAFENRAMPNLTRADSRLLRIEQFPDLFAAIGNRFGGDGQETFALPNVDGPARGVYAFSCTSGRPAGSGGYPREPCLVGEIRTTADLRGVPTNWYPADGRTLQISEHQLLYVLIGDSFGGDGETTFALPKIESPAGLSNQICFFGEFPSRTRSGPAGRVALRGRGSDVTPGVMENEFVAGLRLRASNFAPAGTQLAQGQIMPIGRYPALYSLLGSTFGGDGGKSNFALPKVRSPQPNVPSPGQPVLNWIVNIQGIYPVPPDQD